MARAMVAEHGMSPTIGPVAIGASQPATFLYGPVQQPEPLAEETAREIDLEVKRLMTDSYAVALSVLGERRRALDELARLLLDREVVVGDDVRKLVSAGSNTRVHVA
jgi:cell division protease FtsH